MHNMFNKDKKLMELKTFIPTDETIKNIQVDRGIQRKSSLPVNSCFQINLCLVNSHTSLLQIRNIYFVMQWKGKCKASNSQMINIPEKVAQKNKSCLETYHNEKEASKVKLRTEVHTMSQKDQCQQQHPATPPLTSIGKQNSLVIPQSTPIIHIYIHIHNYIQKYELLLKHLI